MFNCTQREEVWSWTTVVKYIPGSELHAMFYNTVIVNRDLTKGEFSSIKKVSYSSFLPKVIGKIMIKMHSSKTIQNYNFFLEVGKEIPFW